MRKEYVGYFGDNRLRQNGEFFYRMMLEKQTVCLRQLGGNRAGEMKLGRWLANESVTEEELVQTLTDKVQTLAQGRHVLAIQDTSELNYQAHANRVVGLGPVGNNRDVGFFIHPMLVLDANDATCLGFADIKTWIRKWSKKADRKSLLIEEK